MISWLDSPIIILFALGGESMSPFSYHCGFLRFYNCVIVGSTVLHLEHFACAGLKKVPLTVAPTSRKNETHENRSNSLEGAVQVIDALDPILDLFGTFLGVLNGAHLCNGSASQIW